MDFRSASRQPGFTLTELAITLVIIGFITTAGMALIANYTQVADFRESQAVVNLVRDRIIGYTVTNYRLPAYASGGGTDELTNLSPQIRDRWAKKLVYIYDTQLTRTDTNQLVCAKKTTNLIVRYCDDLACSTPTTQSNVAFVLFSLGRNVVNQTGAATTPHSEALSTDASYSGPDGTPGSPRTVTLYARGASVGPYTATSSNVSENDDIVQVVTLEDLRVKLNCQGSPLRIINNDLPTGAASTAYSSTIYADGGVPVSATLGNFRWCAETTSTISTIVTTEVVRPDSSTNAIGLVGSGACSAAQEGSWVTGSSFRIRGSGASNALNTTVAGTYDITIYVRDDQNPDASVTTTTDQNDNITYRKFVLGINGT